MIISSPGTALDLGCGEGGDTLWLARRGWYVTAVDLSGVAISRVAERARAAGLAGEISAGRGEFPAGLREGAVGDRGERAAASPAGEISADRRDLAAALHSRLAGSVVAERHDLATTFPAGRFDLVSARHLSISFALPGARVIRRAAMAPAPGGGLLVVDHLLLIRRGR